MGFMAKFVILLAVVIAAIVLYQFVPGWIQQAVPEPKASFEFPVYNASLNTTGCALTVYWSVINSGDPAHNVNVSLKVLNGAQQTVTEKSVLIGTLAKDNKYTTYTVLNVTSGDACNAVNDVRINVVGYDL